MRGKVVVLCEVLNNRRITPAYAGKSKEIPGEMLSIGDHPRLCGEKTVSQVLALTFLGSPPPMRGKVHDPIR